MALVASGRCFLNWWRRRKKRRGADDKLEQALRELVALRVQYGLLLGLTNRVVALEKALNSLDEKSPGVLAVLGEIDERLAALERFGAVRQMADRDDLVRELDDLGRSNPGLSPYT